MDLILAIIIGLSLVFQSSLEKKTKQESERRHQQNLAHYRSRREAWIGKVTNRSIEKEVEEGYRRRDSELICELRATIDRLAGKIPAGDETNIRILMANRHLLCYNDATRGIEIKLSHGNSADAYYDSQIYLAWWINQKLIEGGLNEEMYLYSHVYYYPFGYKDYRPGFVVWSPMAFASSIGASINHLDRIGYFKDAVKREFHM